MASKNNKLRNQLRDAGLSNKAIDAAWPEWWSDELSLEPSGRAELRFALAKRLGLSPRSLIGEKVEFIWQDDARFKHLSTNSNLNKAAISSFGTAIGNIVIRATGEGRSIVGTDSGNLRAAVLAGREFVDLPSLLGLCWGVGIPVIYLRVFPLKKKSMHAMVVRMADRYAILLCRDAQYPAPVAFTLAHEIGHIARGHLAAGSAVIDMEDPAVSKSEDAEEIEADQYGLSLLTGSSEPTIETSVDNFNAPTLAKSVIQAGPPNRIEPGTLALCLAHQRGVWPIAMSSLKFIYDRPHPVWRNVNAFADQQFDYSLISDDSSQWIRRVMGLDD